MLKSQKLQQELAEKAAKIKTLQEGTKEYASLAVEIASLGLGASMEVQKEIKARAELGAQDGTDLEKQSLIKRARVGDFIKSVIEHTPVKGASAEAREAFGCSGEHEIPLELFEPIDKTKAVTPAPASGSRPVEMGPTQPYLYQRTVAGFLGIDMPNVGSGVQAYPVLTTATPVAMKGKDEAAPDKAAAITVLKSNVKRCTGSFVTRVEDMAIFPELEPALRRDIPRSIANTLDDQLLKGTGSAPELKSLFSQLTDPTADTDTEGFGTFISTVVGQIDGVHAYSVKDLYALVGKKTYEVMAGLFQANTAVSTADYLEDRLGGLRGTNRIAVPASDNQHGIVRLGMESMCAVAPVWGGIQLVADPYTGAGKGQHILTAYQLISDVLLLRSEAFKQVDFHLA